MNYPLPPGEKNNQLEQTIDTPKSLEERQGNEMHQGKRALKKLQHILGNLEDHVRVPRVGQMFRKSMRNPKLSPLTDLKLHADRE